jgi:hypothetical protein
MTTLFDAYRNQNDNIYKSNTNHLSFYDKNQYSYIKFGFVVLFSTCGIDSIALNISLLWNKVVGARNANGVVEVGLVASSVRRRL